METQKSILSQQNWWCGCWITLFRWNVSVGRKLWNIIIVPTCKWIWSTTDTCTCEWSARRARPLKLMGILMSSNMLPTAILSAVHTIQLCQTVWNCGYVISVARMCIILSGPDLQVEQFRTFDIPTHHGPWWFMRHMLRRFKSTNMSEMPFVNVGVHRLG